jgi:hypothetical protein
VIVETVREGISIWCQIVGHEGGDGHITGRNRSMTSLPEIGFRARWTCDEVPRSRRHREAGVDAQTDEA